MAILSWLWNNVVVGGDSSLALQANTYNQVMDVPSTPAPSRRQSAVASDVRGIIVYEGDGYSNTDFGTQGANAAMEVALAQHYPAWRNTGEWRRWQKLDLSDPYYRYAALLNVFQYANPEGYAFQRNPNNPRQLGFFPN